MTIVGKKPNFDVGSSTKISLGKKKTEEKKDIWVLSAMDMGDDIVSWTNQGLRISVDRVSII